MSGPVGDLFTPPPADLEPEPSLGGSGWNDAMLRTVQRWHWGRAQMYVETGGPGAGWHRIAEGTLREALAAFSALRSRCLEAEYRERVLLAERERWAAEQEDIADDPY